MQRLDPRGLEEFHGEGAEPEGRTPQDGRKARERGEVVTHVVDEEQTEDPAAHDAQIDRRRRRVPFEQIGRKSREAHLSMTSVRSIVGWSTPAVQS